MDVTMRARTRRTRGIAFRRALGLGSGWVRPSAFWGSGATRLAGISLAIAGTGMALVVGHDGAPGWRIVRVLGVGALGLLGSLSLRASRRWLRVETALVASLIAVPVGLGVGVPHLLRTGASLLTAAGTALLLGGLALFACAVAEMARARLAWWGKAPALLAAILALVTMCWTLGQATAVTNVARPPLGSGTPADRGFAYEDVAFPATDGVRLSGWYIESRNGAAVVLAHGAGSTRTDVLDHAAVIARHGYGVLLYDARGHGLSEGRGMDFGWFGDHDIGGAVAFLRERGDVHARRIGAVGLSMGGEQVVGAAATIDDIRVVVAEGATNRVAGDKDWLSDEFGLRGALSEFVDGLTYRLTDLLTSASPPRTLRDAVETSARPTLLIAAGEVPDEARAARFIESAAPDTVQIWVAPGAGHTSALGVHPEEWERIVVGLLDAVIGPSVNGDPSLPPGPPRQGPED